MVLLLRSVLHEQDMSSKAPRTSSKFKSNPRTIKYIAKNSTIVDRAIIQADIIFPASSLAQYFTFKDTSFWNLDSIIKKVDPTISESLINTIIVETQLSVAKLVAIREHGYDADIARFKLAETLTHKLITNLNSSIETLRKISSDPLLVKTIADTMKGFSKDADLFINDLAKQIKDDRLSIFNYAPEAKPLFFIMHTLERINIPLVRLKEDLADSKSIRSAAEYRCASALAWIWWEYLGRHPTTTRNVEARARGSIPKTAFQSFVEEAVPPPPLSEGIMRKVYDDLRFMTNIGITETHARTLLLRARSDIKLNEKGGRDARSLLILMRGSLGERGRSDFANRNPQT